MSDLCNSSAGYKIFSLLGNIFNIIKIIIPIIIIIFGTIDLIKGLINPDNKTNTNLFIKRLISGLAVFFISTIVQYVLGLVNNKENPCLTIFLNPNDETIVAIDIDNIEDKNTCNNLGKPYIWENNECRIDKSNTDISG